jgi:hypothetical protein
MFSAFLNPFTMIAGGALVATPIIIHLINRIRFRRVKWAAMEFLLKAQKKMRRKKILEQLILLFLRCLLVFLAGMLLARYVGCGSGGDKATRPTTHVIILDDTPSMADAVRAEEGAAAPDAFGEGKRLIYEKLVPASAEAQTAQTVHVVRLSDLESVFPERMKKVDGKDVPKSHDELRDEARVNGRSISALEDRLRLLPISNLHRSLLAGLQKGKELLEQAPPDDSRVLHIVSDLRAVDWAAEGPAIQELLRDCKDSGITVHLIDVAHPVRKPDRKNPPFNDNISIVEVRPLSRVASFNQPVDIEVRVKNFGGSDLRDVRLSFYINGQGNITESPVIPHLPANQERIATTTVRFQELSAEEKTKLGPLHRFRLITVTLGTPEAGGLKIDNTRHTVVEVRDSLKVLVVDGRTVSGGVDLRLSPKGDSHFLRTMLTSPKPGDEEYLGKFEVVSGDYASFEKIDLRPFSTVYLMNVPTLSEAAVRNLERFVRDGGGVGVYLGPDVKPDDYTNRMYKGGTGFFPVPLQPEPSKELSAEDKLLRGFGLNPKLMLRNPANRQHPAIKGLYYDSKTKQLIKENKMEQQFLLPIFDRYWPVNRRGPWLEDKDVQELYCLPNESAISQYETPAVELVEAVKKRYNEPKFEKARKYLDPLLEKIRRTPADALPLSELARLLDQVLCDQVNTGDESEPVLREFWAQPEMVEARKLATELRDSTKFGPPLLLVKQFGRGRVAVMTTDASGTHAGDKQWNDWASAKGASWAPVASQIQKYLAGGGDDANRALGERLSADFDFERYEPTVTLNLLSADSTKATPDNRLPWDVKPLGQLTMDKAPRPATDPPDAPEPPLKLSYADAKVPGVYLFTLTRKKGASGPVVGGNITPDPLGDLDFVAAPFNVDALNEGDLRRANTDDLAQYTNRAPLHNTEDLSWIEELKQKPTDLSSRRWLYLVILLVLIAEQAWAVRISYHTKPEDLELHAPSAAAAFAHHAVPTPASSGEPVENGTPAATS